MNQQPFSSRFSSANYDNKIPVLTGFIQERKTGDGRKSFKRERSQLPQTNYKTNAPMQSNGLHFGITVW